jgi:hypothetical protein
MTTTTDDILATLTPEQFAHVCVAITAHNPNNADVAIALSDRYRAATERAQVNENAYRTAMHAIANSDMDPDADINLEAVRIGVAAVMDSLGRPDFGPSSTFTTVGSPTIVVNNVTPEDVAASIRRARDSYVGPEDDEDDGEQRARAMTGDHTDPADDYEIRKQRHDDSIAAASLKAQVVEDYADADIDQLPEGLNYQVETARETEPTSIWTPPKLVSVPSDTEAPTPTEKDEPNDRHISSPNFGIDSIVGVDPTLF